MTAMIVRRPENRLAKLIRMPGGKTIAQAMIDVEAELDVVRDQCHDELTAKLAEIQAQGAVCRDAPAVAKIKALYALCNDVPELAGTVGQPEIAAAALSLCELLDGLLTRSAWSRSSVEVHLDGLRLLREQGDNIGPREKAAVVDGLRRVVERTLR